MTPDLVILGRVASLAGEAGLGWVDGIAIAGGRVTAAGARDAVAGLCGPRTERWTLGGDVVAMPGITDAHLHLASGALEALELDLSDAQDRGEILARIRAAHERMLASGDTDGWLLGHGWSLDAMGGWPTAADLDGVAPDRHAAFWSHDHHGRWLSGPAMRAAGIVRDRPDPEGGIIRRGDDGEPTGILHEHAVKLVAPAIPRPSDERLALAVDRYAAELAAFGLVGVQDPGEMFDDPGLRWGPTFFRRLAEQDRLPLRVAASIRSEQIAAAVERGFRSAEMAGASARGDPLAERHAARYRGGWLKLFADGSLGSRSAALLEPYESESDGRRPVGGPSGMLLDPIEVLADHARRAAARGIAVQIHGIGDAAVRAALDILETLPLPAGGVRHRVEHAQLVDPLDQPRFAALGIVASMQASHLATDAPLIDRAWGARGANAFPLRSIAAAGGALALGTDAPVESVDPWPGIAMAVTRRAPGWESGAYHAEQSIDLDTAIRAATVGPPASCGEVDRGRLVPGQRADIVIVPAAALAEVAGSGGTPEAVRPLATLIDGEVVYRAASFDPGG